MTVMLNINVNIHFVEIILSLFMFTISHIELSPQVEAVNMFNPPTEVVAARDHILHVIYNFLQPAKIWDR